MLEHIRSMLEYTSIKIVSYGMNIYGINYRMNIYGINGKL